MPTGNKHDLSGQRFDRLLVKNETVQRKRGNIVWECLCDCGNTVMVDASSLRTGSTKSCRCLLKENDSNLSHGNARHHGNRTVEYVTWINIKERCYNDKHTSYKWYGGRGITVCDRWLNSFENFLADMGKRPAGKFSIHRRDENKHYGPDNCVWATEHTQKRGRTDNYFIEYSGKKLVKADWASFLNITAASITYHLGQGRTFDFIYNRFKNRIK